MLIVVWIFIVDVPSFDEIFNVLEESIGVDSRNGCVLCLLFHIELLGPIANVEFFSVAETRQHVLVAIATKCKSAHPITVYGDGS